MGKRLTPAQKRKVIQAVDTDTAAGMSKKDALKKAGIASSSYTVWRRDPKVRLQQGNEPSPLAQLLTGELDGKKARPYSRTDAARLKRENAALWELVGILRGQP